MIQQLYEELINEVHKFYKDQSFFKALKNYQPETRKLIIQFLRKKGATPKIDNSWKSKEETEVDYSKSKKPLSKDLVDYFKSIGLKDEEIKRIPQTTLHDDAYIASAERLKTYNFDSLKNQIDSYDEKERENFIRQIIKSIKNKNAEIHKGFVKSTNVEDSFFGASSKSYRSDLTFPLFTYKNYNIQINANTNEDFFVEGHDLIVEVNRDDQSKKYTYKVNMMDKIHGVLEKIWAKVNLSIDKFEKGIEPELEKKSEVKSSGKKVKSDPERIVEKTFSKWYSITKTGKLREVSTDRMPAEVYIYSQGGRNRERTGVSSNPTYVLNVKPKLKRASYDKIEKEFPEFRKWNETYNDAMRQLTNRSYYRENVERILGDKLYTEEHDKFFERLDHVLRRLMANGWYPSSTEGSYKKSDPIKINLTYNEELKNKYQENPKEATKAYFNSARYKLVRNRLHDAHNKITDLPKLYIKNILDFKTR